MNLGHPESPANAFVSKVTSGVRYAVLLKSYQLAARTRFSFAIQIDPDACAPLSESRASVGVAYAAFIDSEDKTTFAAELSLRSDGYLYLRLPKCDSASTCSVKVPTRPRKGQWTNVSFELARSATSIHSTVKVGSDAPLSQTAGSMGKEARLQVALGLIADRKECTCTDAKGKASPCMCPLTECTATYDTARVSF
jgi:hypothetical protein